MKKLCIIFLALVMSSCFSDKIRDSFKIFIGDIADYGNWCGPYNDIKGTPADDLDSCCMEHDLGWQDAWHDKDYLKCGEGDRAELDAELVKCVSKLPDDFSEWNISPLDEGAADFYRNAIIILFTPCMATND